MSYEVALAVGLRELATMDRATLAEIAVGDTA